VKNDGNQIGFVPIDLNFYMLHRQYLVNLKVERERHINCKLLFLRSGQNFFFFFPTLKPASSRLARSSSFFLGGFFLTAPEADAAFFNPFGSFGS